MELRRYKKQKMITTYIQKPKVKKGEYLLTSCRILNYSDLSLLYHIHIE